MTDTERRSGPLPTQPCGTVAAYKRHRRAGDPRCDACWAAWAERARERYAKRGRSDRRKARS